MIKNYPRASETTLLSTNNDVSESNASENDVIVEDEVLQEQETEEPDMYAGQYNGGYTEVAITNINLTPFTNEDFQRAILLNKMKNEEKPFEDVFKIENKDNPNALRIDNIQLETQEDESIKEKILSPLKDLCENIITEREKIAVDKPHVREYTNVAVIPKPNYAKAKKKTNSKVMFFVILGLCVAIFMGVQANSYYWYSGGKASGMSCAFAWITVDNLPTSSKINWSAFFSGFGIWSGIMGIVGLFIYLDNEAKKNSRVGHEHGAAHLGTKNDFKGFKNRFMER